MIPMPEAPHEASDATVKTVWVEIGDRERDLVGECIRDMESRGHRLEHMAAAGVGWSMVVTLVFRPS